MSAFGQIQNQKERIPTDEELMGYDHPACGNCGSELQPAASARGWDGHSFWCRCTGPEIIISIG